MSSTLLRYLANEIIYALVHRKDQGESKYDINDADLLQKVTRFDSDMRPWQQWNAAARFRWNCNLNWLQKTRLDRGLDQRTARLSRLKVSVRKSEVCR